MSSRFQVILREVFVFYTPGGLCRSRRPWSKFCIIEDIVVSYTSKVEIPISRYFQVILIRGVFVFGSQVLGLRFLPTLTQELISKVAFVNWYIDYASVNFTCTQPPHVYMYVYISSLTLQRSINFNVNNSISILKP